MSRRVWIAVLAGAVVATAGALTWRSGTESAGAATPIGPPAIDCPREIDLGTVPINRQATAVLAIRNTGGEPLTIGDVSTSCGCLGVQLLPGHEDLKAPATVTIAPASRIEVAFPLSIAGVHGVQTGQTVRFKTNAPETPEVEVRLMFTPNATHFADPGTVSLGELIADAALPARTVSLFSTDDRDRPTVTRVASTNPERVTATFLPEDPSATPVAADGARGSRRFGRVKLEFGPVRVGTVLDEKVLVFIEGQVGPALAVVVSGRVLKPVELLPDVLYLPHTSLSGPPVYSGVSLCRSTGNEPLSLRVGSIPAGLTVRVSDAATGTGPVRVVVEADPKVARAESVVQLTAQRGGRDYPLTLKVVIDPVREE